MQGGWEAAPHAALEPRSSAGAPSSGHGWAPPFSRPIAALACWGPPRELGGTAGEQRPPAPACLQASPTRARPPCAAGDHRGIGWPAAGRAGCTRARAECQVGAGLRAGGSGARRRQQSHAGQQPLTYTATPRQPGQLHARALRVRFCAAPEQRARLVGIAAPAPRAGAACQGAAQPPLRTWRGTPGAAGHTGAGVAGCGPLWPPALPAALPLLCSLRLGHRPGLQHVRVRRLQIQGPAEQPARLVKPSCRTGAGTGAGSGHRGRLEARDGKLSGSTRGRHSAGSRSVCRSPGAQPSGHTARQAPAQHARTFGGLKAAPRLQRCNRARVCLRCPLEQAAGHRRLSCSSLRRASSQGGGNA